MSESEKKEQNPIDQPKAAEKDEFLEALVKDGDEGLKAAFQVLSKGEPTTRVEDTDLKRAVAIRDPQISIPNAKEIIQQVNEEGLFNSEEFVDIINMIITLRTMKEDSVESLKKAFDILRRGGPTVRVKDIQLAIAIQSPEISTQNADDIIQLVNKEGSINCEEFVDIFNMIIILRTVKKDNVESLKKAFNILRRGGPTVRVKDVQLAVAIRGPEISTQNAEEIIQLVNKEGSINCEEFVDIFKLLEEADEADQTKKIYKKLKDIKEEDEIILYGVKGVGKTWTAREVSALAVREGDFDVVIWVYLNRIYEDFSLQKSIASQLSVLAEYEKFVAEEVDKERDEETKKEEPEKIENAGLVRLEEIAKDKTKRDKMKSLIKEAIKEKKILFILDGDGVDSRTEATILPGQKEKEERAESDEQKKEEGEKSGTDETEKKEDGGEKKDTQKKVGEKEGGEKIVVLELSRGGKKVNLELVSLKSYKVLKTSARYFQHELGDNEIIVKPLSWGKSKSLATRAIKREGVEINIKELEELARYFMIRSERFPAQILLISRIVSYFGKEEELRLQKEELALQKGGELGLQKLIHDREMIRNGQGVKLLDVLIKGYEERLPKSVLIDCYSPETPEDHFMHRGTTVSFNELICYWIIEGHLGHFDRIDEAYLKGHRVLMELMDCGLLQKHEGNYVALSGATTFNFHIHDYEAFFRGLRPGVGVTFDMSLGGVTLGDGMIRTISSNNGDQQIISTLLLDGNRIGEEERPTKSLCKHKDLVEVLAIFDPTSQHFELPILEMRKLRLLALRGCWFLDSLDRFLYKKSDQENAQSVLLDKKSDEENDQSVLNKKSDKKNDQSPKTPIPRNLISENLEALTVLEISGSSLLEKIPDELFRRMPKLKTLNMSQLVKVQFLPQSFYNLPEIEFLILRGCKSLRELKSLKNFKNLKVLDVSNATSFEKFDDKSLHINAKLQILNLSNTQLKTLPLINQLKNLKFVWLGDCQVLPRIRKIDKMENLKIFDIAGAIEVERFCDPSLEDLKNLVIVDISRTKIRRLPANIGDPTYLHANNCLKLKVVPPVEGLTKLQVLDLSGCVRLREVREEFFAKLKESLRELNLSNTKVEHLSFLSSLISLRRLLLSECKFLEKIEKLSCLDELEFLDLSGCEKVMELEDGSFDKMIHLHHLNLSRTGLGGQQKPLPSLSKLKSLKELHVRDCPNLTKLPGVEEVSSLEVLDYSGTVLESPPSFSNPDRPKVVGAGIESIDTIQLFKNLGAQQQGNAQSVKWDFKQEEVSQCQWIISNSRVENEEEKLGKSVYGVHFLRLLKNYPSFLTENLRKFYFLVYPSEAEARVKARFPDDNPYSEEVSLREIYLEQVCKEKMDRCLEIREFNKLPESLHPLVAQAQFVVLVDDTFLTSLLDLRVDSTMPIKACWIESCNELEYVVAAPDQKVEKTEEAAESEEEQRKNAAAAKSAELLKGEPEKWKKFAAQKAREAAKGKDDQQKNGADEKVGESAKSEGDQQQNAAEDKSGEATKGEGDQQKNAEDKKAGESATSDGDQPKNAAADNAGESAKGEGDEQKNAAEGKSVDSAKNEGDERKNATEEKSVDSTKNESDQPKNAAADNAGESEKGEGDQQKSTTEEKSVDSAKNEGGEKKTAADEKSEKPAKKEGEQPKSDNAGESAKIKGEEAKNAAEDLKNLETLWISDVLEMKSVCKGDIKSVNFNFLKSLYLEFCPHLSEICSSSLQLQSLETLYIKYCEKLKSLFTDDNNPSEMGKLRHLQLWGLDSLEKINCKTPILRKLRVGECPLLEHLISSRLGAGSQQENEGHEHLEILHIKSCNKLKGIFESLQDDVRFERLTELELLVLPSLRNVALAAPALRSLRVGDCPSLKSVIAAADGVPNLEILQVTSCDKMKVIIDGSGSELGKLTKIELLGLPELENVGAHVLPGRKVCTIWACPKLNESEFGA